MLNSACLAAFTSLHRRTVLPKYSPLICTEQFLSLTEHNRQVSKAVWPNNVPRKAANNMKSVSLNYNPNLSLAEAASPLCCVFLTWVNNTLYLAHPDIKPRAPDKPKVPPHLCITHKRNPSQSNHKYQENHINQFDCISARLHFLKKSSGFQKFSLRKPQQRPCWIHWQSNNLFLETMRIRLIAAAAEWNHTSSSFINLDQHLSCPLLQQNETLISHGCSTVEQS